MVKPQSSTIILMNGREKAGVSTSSSTPPLVLTSAICRSVYSIPNAFNHALHASGHVANEPYLAVLSP